MQFAHPEILWLFLIYVPLTVWYIAKHRNAYPAMSVSTASPFRQLPSSIRGHMLHLLFVLKMLALGCLIIILARPQTHDSWNDSTIEGTDIILAIDTSSSMLARDFRPDRLGAAKEVAIKFVNDRENDNIGVVIFAGESLTGVPMTTDRAALVNYLSLLTDGMIEDGTAIGDGLATSINRIKDGKAKSKSIILLTDGSNNTGVVAPLTAAEIARELGIKVYTIGVGTNGMADYPQIDYFGRLSYVKMPVVIDEATLKQIAETTGGKYFRATDNKVLQQVFDEINALEKSVLDVRRFSHTEDNYLNWAIAALALVLAEILLRNTVLRTIP